jgi:small multidrug resistance family-3 protein
MTTISEQLVGASLATPPGQQRPGGRACDESCDDACKRVVMKPITFLLLVIATGLEAGGDAVVRAGLGSAVPVRIVLLALGGVMLFGYGVFLTSAPVDFGRLLGMYVVLFFLTAQVLNLVAFGVRPTPSLIVGGAFIIFGGCIIAANHH